MNIQMVDLRSQYELIREEVNFAIQEVIDSSKFINGPAVNSFSEDLKTYLNTCKQLIVTS